MKVFDGSPKDSHSRFLCEASQMTVKDASSGNPIAMIRDALAVVYWYQLD